MKSSLMLIALLALFFVALFGFVDSENVVLDESFNLLSGTLQSAVDENIPPSILGWTHTPPEGWSVDNSKMASQKGMTEWQGWSFATLDFWTSADAQDRGNFLLSDGVIAIADPDEWDDLNNPSASGYFNSVLISPPISVQANQTFYLHFDSHYRQENPQRAQVLVSIEGQPDTVLLNYQGGLQSDNYGEDRQNEHVVLSLPTLASPGTIRLKWQLSNAGNNWYWAIDNIKVTDQIPPPTPTPTAIPTPTPAPVPVLARGPFVHYLREDSVNVMWETIQESPSIVEYGLSQPNQRVEISTPTTRHQVVLTGLQSDSDYVFAIKTRMDGEESYGGTFRFDSTFDGGMESLDSLVSPYEEDSLTAFYEQAAERIIAQTSVTKGYCLVYGFEKGRLAFEIAKRSSMRIIGIEEDAEKIAYARACLRKAGVYGDRISVHQGSLSDLPYGNYFANLIVSDRFLLEGKPSGSASEILRVLRPCGGVLCFGQPSNASAVVDRDAWSSWLAEGGISGFEMKENGNGFWISKTREPLPDTGEWTHQYAEPGNSACSGDQLVQDPMQVLWFGRPGPRLIINRHSRPMAPLYKNGRIFIPGDDRIITIDAYNGTRLWDLSVPGSRRMGAFKGSAPMALTDESIYVAQGSQCHAVDVVTGLPVLSLNVPQPADAEEPLDWGYIGCLDTQIVGSAHPKGAPFYEYSANGNCDELEGDGRACMVSDSLFSYNRLTGELLWTYQNGAILESTLAMGDGCIYFAENRKLPAPRGEWERPGRRWVGTFNAGQNTFLVALDLQTGKPVWEKNIHLPFTEMMYLVYSEGRVVTVGTYNKAGKCYYALFAYDAKNGEFVWSDDYDSGQGPDGSHGEQWQHPVVMGGSIFSRPNFYNLQTGAKEKFTLNTGGRCGTYSASSNYLFAREGNPTYYPYGATRPTSRPLTKVTRPGCFINIIPVGGLVLLPESSSGCTCEYSVQTSMAFIAE